MQFKKGNSLQYALVYECGIDVLKAKKALGANLIEPLGNNNVNALVSDNFFEIIASI